MKRSSPWLTVPLLLLASCGDDKGTQPPTDTSPPAAIQNLAVESATLAGITLGWTAAGDDGFVGTASRYDLRYSKTSISSSSWDSATVASPMPVPVTAGIVQRFTIPALPAGTWYFALRTADEVPNWSALSNVVSAVMPAVVPFRVTDLTAVASTEGTITLEWTAPGEEAPSTPATAYDLRYAPVAITASNWEQASRVLGLPVPAPRGTRESFIVTSLGPETSYFFALKTEGEEGHWSDLSNVANRTTVALSYVRLTSSSQPMGVGIGTWAPDGESVVFAADWLERGVFQLYRMPATGGDPVVLTSDPKSAYAPSWSPDGTKLAFLTFRSQGGRVTFVLSTMDATPGALPTVLGTYRASSVGRPAWSPDGNRLVYAVDASFEPRVSEIYTISAAGGTPTLLVSAAVNGMQPAWSPDGTKIAFCSNLPPYGIRVIPITGGDPVQLTTGTAAEGGQFPAWSPDGTHIAYSSIRSGNAEIWVISSTGESPIRLTSTLDGENAPFWAPDGRAIGVTRKAGSGGSQIADIWVLRL